MKYSFYPEAEAEFNYAIEYYESCAQGLGADFAVEIFSTIERIITHPKAWPILEDEIRRIQTIRFPYGILYIEEPEEIFILAIMHLHRYPDYWKERKGM